MNKQEHPHETVISIGRDSHIQCTEGGVISCMSLNDVLNLLQ
jgi:hypothetical protein